MEIEEAGGAGEDELEMEAPSVSTVAIAVNGSRNSKHALKWALDKFVPEGKVLFQILHVRPTIKMVPTPSETFLPLDSLNFQFLQFTGMGGKYAVFGGNEPCCEVTSLLDEFFFFNFLFLKEGNIKYYGLLFRKF